jgi:hypothetical protein
VLRNGLVRAGLKTTESPNKDFFVGRNPVETAAKPARRAAAE